MKIAKPHRHLPFLCSFLIGFLTFQTQAQEENTAWMLQDLLSDSTAVAEINSFEVSRFTHSLYVPNDLSYPGIGEERNDIIIKTKRGPFVLIDGTGRVYPVQKLKSGIDFVRIDSTYYSGYNFGAYNFTVHDTIFSLGGYGIWRTNGLLRYYKPSSYGSEILPLNKELIVDYSGRLQKAGLWLNVKNDNLYYVKKRIAREHLKEVLTTNYFLDTTEVWHLDLNSKNWTLSGVTTSEGMSILKNSRRLLSTPLGELIFAGPLPAQTLYLLNYQSNQVLLLSKEKAGPILNLLFPNSKTFYNNRCMFYFKDSTLHLVTSAKEHLKLTLKPSDFTLTNLSIYEPIKEKSAWSNISWLSLITFSIGMVLSIGAVVLVLRNQRKDQHNSVTEKTIFSATEIELMKTVFAKPDHAMAAEEMNYVLGTSKKSVDVQKKQRSEIIRSINKKYTTLCSDTESLLATNKLDNDKRLVQYVVHTERYKKLSSLIDG